MKTHEELARIIETLEERGWQRLNGNTWTHPKSGMSWVTSYAHQEATLTFVTRKGKRSQHYRGAHPLEYMQRNWF